MVAFVFLYYPPTMVAFVFLYNPPIMVAFLFLYNPLIMVAFVIIGILPAKNGGVCVLMDKIQLVR